LTEKEIGQAIQKLHDIMAEWDVPAPAAPEKSTRALSRKAALSTSP
jgi:hypothetical protein